MAENDSLLAQLKKEGEKEEKKGLESAGAEDALKQEQMLRNGMLGGESQYSLLSPNRKENKEAQKDEYISPFSDEFLNRTDKRDEEFEEEVSKEGAVPHVRVQAFLMLGLVLYAMALIIGYYNTPYSDGVPQVVTGEEIDGRKYISQANDYLNYIQTVHEQTVDDIENYTADLMSASELTSQMKKSNTEIEKKKKEVEDMTVPSEYEDLQEGLKAMYDAQVSMNSAAMNYAASKTEQTFTVVSNINEKYEGYSDSVIDAFDQSFR